MGIQYRSFLLLLACLLAVDATHGSDGFEEMQKQHRQSEKQILAAISKKVELTTAKQSLGEALTSLGRIGKFPLWIDRNALAEEEIRLDQPIRFPHKRLTIETVMEHIGRSLGIDWYIDRGVFIVTTEIVSEEITFTRVFNVRKLSRELLKQNDPPSPVWKYSRGRLGELGVGSGMFSVADHRKKKTKTDRRSYELEIYDAGDGDLSELRDILIQQTNVSWIDMSGTGGEIMQIGDSLIVRQNYRGLQDVEAILKALESCLGTRTKAIQIPAVADTYPTQEDRRIQAQLSKRFDYEFGQTTLTDALKVFSKQLKVPLLLDKFALSDEGVDENATVHLNASELTIDSAMRRIFEPLGLEYYIDRGVVVVTVAIAAEEVMTTIVYPIHEICDRGMDPQTLIDMLMQTTRGPWWDNGGVSTITQFGKRALVCRQTHENHADIARIIREIRSSTDVLSTRVPKRTTKSYSLHRFAKRFRKSDNLNRDPIDEAITVIKEHTDFVPIRPIGDVIVVNATEAEHEAIDQFIKRHLKRKKP